MPSVGRWVYVGNEGSITTQERKRTAHVNSVSRLTAGRGADDVVGDSILIMDSSYVVLSSSSETCGGWSTARWGELSG